MLLYMYNICRRMGCSGRVSSPRNADMRLSGSVWGSFCPEALFTQSYTSTRVMVANGGREVSRNQVTIVTKRTVLNQTNIAGTLERKQEALRLQGAIPE